MVAARAWRWGCVLALARIASNNSLEEVTKNTVSANLRGVVSVRRTSGGKVKWQIANES